MNGVRRQGQDSPYRQLGTIFFERVKELGERTFVKVQRRDRFEEVSWKEFGSRVREAILGLHSLGLRKGDRVVILSENRLEWLCADIATMAGGLTNVVISPRLSDLTILKVLGHSRARAAFVEDEIGLGRLLNLKGQLPSLAHVIVMDRADPRCSEALTFEQLLGCGRGVAEERLHEILDSVNSDDLATIMYTSGSTGEPKGVMRTHGNLLSNISNGTAIRPAQPEDLSAIILSLNHLLGRYGFHKSVAVGRSAAIVEATEENVDIEIIRKLSPTSMSLVPRVMEKIWQMLLNEGENQSHWEAIEALDRARASRGTLGSPEQRRFEALREFLRESVLRALGGRIRYVSYGGAPMPPGIMRFFEVIGIPLLGGYGLTECGGVSLSGLGENRPGSLGKPFPNVELRIAEDGEVLVRGPTVTPGYFENPEATREVLEPDGWFHTGDLGSIDPDGSLRIVGRKKDIFYCSDGSNIYPGYVELVLENDPLIRQAVLLGDRRPFIAALLVPDRERVAAELEAERSSMTDADVERVLWSRIEKINERLEHYEKVRKIVVLKDDFPERVRSITAFQKIKVDRKAVAEQYGEQIVSIYGKGPSENGPDQNEGGIHSALMVKKGP